MAETQRTLGPREGESTGNSLQLDAEVDDARIKARGCKFPSAR